MLWHREIPKKVCAATILSAFAKDAPRARIIEAAKIAAELNLSEEGSSRQGRRTSLRRPVTASHNPRRVWPTCWSELSFSADVNDPLWSALLDYTMELR